MGDAGKLEGQVALVAGGAGGIGRRVAAALASEGAAVTLVGRSQANLDEARAALVAAQPGAALETIACDLRDYAACQSAIQTLGDRLGRLDIVVNSANTPVGGVGGAFAGVDPSAFTPFLEASLTTLFNLCHATLPLVQQGGGGAILAFASDSGLFAAPNQTMIGPTRAAIMMFCRSLALEVAASGVRVNCISTSFVQGTPVFDQVMASPIASRAQTAMRRAGLGLPDADDLARLALFLAGPDAAHLTGQVVSVNGGVSA